MPHWTVRGGKTADCGQKLTFNESMNDVLFLIHLGSTWAALGLIWTVQRVVYPAFLHFSDQDFTTAHAAHMRRIGPIVAPLMLIEAGTGLWVWAVGWRGIFTTASLIALVAIWLSTALVQIPIHTTLSRHPSSQSVQRLIRTNWIRTGLWTVRAILVTLAPLFAK
jgi:hypothetical protein